jgi:hypothetical protein
MTEHWRTAWGGVLALTCLASGIASEAPPPAGPEEGGPGVLLLDGSFIRGEVVEADGGAVRIGGHAEPVPYYEIREIRFHRGTAPPGAPAFDAGPLISFRDGELLRGRLLEAGETTARIEVAGLPQIEVPLEALRAFRLREAHREDGIFEREAKGAPPRTDTVFVRRSGLLRIAGSFKGLSSELLSLEYDGAVRRLSRQIVQGVIFAPVASARPEPDPAASFEVAGAGRLPAYLAGIDRSGEAAVALVRLPGAPPEARVRLPLESLGVVSFQSDRLVFLSDLTPVLVEETPVIGRPFPYRKDQSVAGTPMALAGRVFRRGLGVHSRCVLEYAIDRQYRSFAAVVGLDDSSGGRGSVAFSVLADGKEIFRREMAGKAAPEPISLPMDGVERLRLVVDYGEDGLDFGDHASWADARLSK